MRTTPGLRRGVNVTFECVLCDFGLARLIKRDAPGNVQSVTFGEMKTTTETVSRN